MKYVYAIHFFARFVLLCFRFPWLLLVFKRTEFKKESNMSSCSSLWSWMSITHCGQGGFVTTVKPMGGYKFILEKSSVVCIIYCIHKKITKTKNICDNNI
jgi:hypothetical protein